MAKEVFMPKLSSTMSIGTLLQWFKEVGDYVEVGEPLFEIMTDKINIEVESYEEGTLLKKYAKVDEDVPVNAVIGYIGEKGEEVPEQPPVYSKEDVEDTGLETMSEKEELKNDQNLLKQGKIRATPAAKRVAAEHNIELSSIQGTGPEGRIQEQDVRDSFDQKRVLSTPLAGKIAMENNLDIGAIAGTGSRGKIVKSDVLTHMNIKESVDTVPEIWKLSGLRKVIAQKMTESVQTIPHVTLTSEVDMSNAVSLRRALLPTIEQQTGYRLSYTEIIMKAVSYALRLHPRLNASLVENEIIMNHDIHIGLAVALDDALIVPSVKQADTKGLAELTKTSKMLGEKARNNQLSPEEMSGSTFTISNLGMYAIDGFTPIINPPETAILGVGRIMDKPVIVNGEVAVRPMMVTSLSFDHRAIDGAPAAAFLTELKSLLEDPYRWLV
ncbi:MULTISPECIES: dihydrolipoamide acetyltransferase family protein [Clostridia]|uniref:dihydrolipoamide acetyltransferase family protein n=1 Tax=Clostridia TaxID=186801 RepID=UPI000EA0FB14|nr:MULTISPECIES: dihydrolipoamide acetyltransferase family protein [Clostridia]NBJ68146.1 2-oxo acid dehydrogenase subunit E2 [Roseburia sp. 1XD42-34]RKI81920.1 2-oxo acid dehydrogenase subunit E2 [Clostridium sp. 1xD42-85]